MQADHGEARTSVSGGDTDQRAHTPTPGLYGWITHTDLSDVADARASFDRAIGAEPVMEPERVMDGVTIALVRAPGGVVIGFSGP